jgi:hypothetical protein
VTMAENWESL